jgi:release factor glutamine methyltransferase
MKPSVGNLISSAVARLPNSDSARLDAELLLAKALGKNRTWLFTWPEYQPSAEQITEFESLLAERNEGKPIAYILRRREFWSLELECSEDTLIPRPETELLVEIALSLQLPGDAKILDLGTGTGAIALALKSERPEWQITAVDLMPGAIELAKRNAINLDISGIQWQQGNWFEPLPESATFDLIVSNPPYVEEGSPYLKLGDVRYEPQSALIAGKDGMGDIRAIAAQAQPYLSANGYVLFEHGHEQSDLVRKVFLQNGYQFSEGFKDLNSLHRATVAQNQKISPSFRPPLANSGPK